MKWTHLFVIILLVSCNDGRLEDHRKCLQLVNSDCYIFFEKGFDGQKLDVYVNNVQYESRTLRTDPVLDLAGEIHIKSDTVNSITLVIDDTKIATFCPYPFIQVNHKDEKFNVVVAEKPTPYQ